MSISTKFTTKRPERRPMLQPLDRFLGLTIEKVRSTELDQFAEEHKHFVVMSDSGDEVLFLSGEYTFKIRADYDPRIDKTVYQGLIESHAPYEILFDTNYRYSVDKVLTMLRIGAKNMGLGKGGGDLEDEDVEEEFDA